MPTLGGVSSGKKDAIGPENRHFKQAKYPLRHYKVERMTLVTVVF
jgi:hypothetical protein